MASWNVTGSSKVNMTISWNGDGDTLALVDLHQGPCDALVSYTSCSPHILSPMVRKLSFTRSLMTSVVLLSLFSRRSNNHFGPLKPVHPHWPCGSSVIHDRPQRLTRPISATISQEICPPLPDSDQMSPHFHIAVIFGHYTKLSKRKQQSRMPWSHFGFQFLLDSLPSSDQTLQKISEMGNWRRYTS